VGWEISVSISPCGISPGPTFVGGISASPVVAGPGSPHFSFPLSCLSSPLPLYASFWSTSTYHSTSSTMAVEISGLLPGVLLLSVPLGWAALVCFLAWIRHLILTRRRSGVLGILKASWAPTAGIATASGSALPTRRRSELGLLSLSTYGSPPGSRAAGRFAGRLIPAAPTELGISLPSGRPHTFLFR